MEFTLFMLRWLHFLAGITWIGILYYFNFVQTPFFAETEAAVRTGAIQKLVPRALWWFRWGAMFTFLAGISIYIHANGRDGRGAILFIILRCDDHRRRFDRHTDVSQRLARDLAQSADRDRVGQSGRIGRPGVARCRGAGRRAALTSRTNTVFSIPMLLYMGAASHYPPMVHQSDSRGFFWLLVIVIIGAVECNALIGTQGPTKVPLDSVKGALWIGFLLAGILFLLDARH